MPYGIVKRVYRRCNFRSKRFFLSHFQRLQWLSNVKFFIHRKFPANTVDLGIRAKNICVV